jgi:hypothetical protein
VNGWHDEWVVVGDPGADFPPYTFTYDSRDARWEGQLAEVTAREFVKQRLTEGTWVDGPHLARQRVFRGELEPVNVTPQQPRVKHGHPTRACQEAKP